MWCATSMLVSAPIKDAVHQRLEEDAYALARHFTPRAVPYVEMWLDGEKVDYPFLPLPSTPDDPEPIYSMHYMPRKFKIGVGIPEDNSLDILTNDLAILALFDGNVLQGYNIAVGGGLGMNHNQPKTYPRLATPVVFVGPDDLIKISEAVVKLQRDHGDRDNRKHARLKYVVEEKGLTWTKRMLEDYFGDSLEDARPMPEFKVVDHMGWHEQGDGKWYLGVPVSSGRIVDRENEKIRTGLRAVIAEYRMPLILSADQNIILCDIEEKDKTDIAAKLRSYGIKLREDISELYRYFLACVALPTCGKALAEAERVKLPLVADMEAVMAKHGLADLPIYVSMAGCPNGCSRPYTGEIGIVGRTPGTYAIFIGGSFDCTRLNVKIFDKVPYDDLMALFDALFAQYIVERAEGEGFGDFCHRVGEETVKAEVVEALGETFKWAV